MSYVEKDGHAFDDCGICVKCGTSQVKHEDSGRRPCTGQKPKASTETFSVPD